MTHAILGALGNLILPPAATPLPSDVRNDIMHLPY